MKCEFCGANIENNASVCPVCSKKTDVNVVSSASSDCVKVKSAQEIDFERQQAELLKKRKIAYKKKVMQLERTNKILSVLCVVLAIILVALLILAFKFSLSSDVQGTSAMINAFSQVIFKVNLI